MSDWWSVLVTGADGTQAVIGPWRSFVRAETRATRLRAEGREAEVMLMEAP